MAVILQSRPRVTALNKCDAMDDVDQAKLHNELEQHVGDKVHQISGVAQHGLTDVLREIRTTIDKRNKVENAPEAEDAKWRP